MPAVKILNRPVPTTNAVKGALKATFKDSHIHNFLRTLVEASIELRGDYPMQEFVVGLQELLKNDQMVNKYFAFCPVKEASNARHIYDPSSIPTSMTLLSGHFKLSSTRGRNPFEKQKVYRNNKEVKGEFRHPSIYFSTVIATDEELEELLARISHEWHMRGGIILRVKELQSFDSKTILCLFNVLTATRKKTILAELGQNLAKSQEQAQELDATEFLWDPNELPRFSTLPALELRLQNPKTPGHDTSQYSKLSWRAQANCKV